MHMLTTDYELAELRRERKRRHAPAAPSRRIAEARTQAFWVIALIIAALTLVAVLGDWT